MAQILIFGDSITWGAWDEEGGWAQRFKKEIDKKAITANFTSYHSVYNLGISGDNTNDLLERFESETQRRLDEGEEAIILFAIGINDHTICTCCVISEEQSRCAVIRAKDKSFSCL